MTTIESDYCFDVTSLMTPDITGVGVYTKHLFFALRELGCPVSPVYKLSRYKKRKFIKDHIGEKARAFIPLFQRRGLLHGTDFKLLTSSLKVKRVLTIHDLAVFREELLETSFCKAGQKKIIKEIAQNPDAIIVPTNFVRQELITRFPGWEDKVFAIHHGCDHLYDVAKKYKESPSQQNYFLYVGRLEKRKNIVGLIDAFDLFCEENRDIHLLIVGSDGYGASEIKKRIEKSPYRQRIILKGYVGNEELKKLYQKAVAFVYPSYYEGFGIPIVEAMKMGVPVLTSRFGAMEEVGAEGALLVDTCDKESFSKSLVELASNGELRNQLIRRGHNRSLEFTWERAAEKTLSIYNSLS